MHAKCLFFVLTGFCFAIYSVSSRASNGGRRSRRNVRFFFFLFYYFGHYLETENLVFLFEFQSSESSSTMGGRTWKKKQLRATSLKPFKLRTEVKCTENECLEK